MKTLLTVALVVFAASAVAQETPKFYKDTYPEHALASRLEAEDVLMGKGAKLDAKTRELVALGVAAQVPCTYCIYYHTKAARAPSWINFTASSVFRASFTASMSSGISSPCFVAATAAGSLLESFAPILEVPATFTRAWPGSRPGARHQSLPGSLP